MELPEVLQETVDLFSKLPGIGPKSAMRQALNLTNWSVGELHSFGDNLKNLSLLKKCNECGMFASERLCQICTNHERVDSQKMCVVENISDLMAIEHSRQFRGLFHVLGGVLNPLMGIGPAELNLEFFVSRVKKYQINDLILAINPSVEGDATCSYLKDILPQTLTIGRIGFGVPMGGSLEYLDSLTIAKALENRTSL